VLDFGLAKLVSIERKLELEPLTQAGMCFGTPQYMAPEQMQGKPASESADLWAVAVIAYEMLSGRLPWDGTDPREVFRAVLSSPPPPLERVHPSVSPQRAALDRFFGEALAKTPKGRPADAAAFFAAFELALFGRPRHTGPIFSTIISAELQAPDVELEGGGDALPENLSDTWQDGSSPLDAMQSTMPGKVGGPPGSGRRLHSMWSMMSTLPPLSPGEGDEAPLLEAPPLVRKSGSIRTPDADAHANGEALYPVKRRESVTDMLQAPPSRGAPMRWVVLAAVCLIVVAALAGYFIGRAPR
jgi:serine/threonine protein kinase